MYLFHKSCLFQYVVVVVVVVVIYLLNKVLSIFFLFPCSVLDMSGSKVVGQDVRFLSNQCWIWWSKPKSCGDYCHTTNSCEFVNNEDEYDLFDRAECIDGETGLKIMSSSPSTFDLQPRTNDNNNNNDDNERSGNQPNLEENEVTKIHFAGSSNSNTFSYSSEASTFSFTKSFLDLITKMKHEKIHDIYNILNEIDNTNRISINDHTIRSSRSSNRQEEQHKVKFHGFSLKALRRMKRILSPEYESAKDALLHHNAVFRHWRRREYYYHHYEI